MSNAAKLFVPLLLIAALAGGAYLALQHSSPDAPPVTPTRQDAPPTPREPATEQPLAPARTETPPQEPRRIAADVAAPNTHADAPQGIRGRVLQPNGAIAAGVPVWLLESASQNMVQVYLKNQAGQVTPPLGNTVTADDGTFSLGVRTPGKAVDLRIVSAEHPELNRPGIKVREGDWFDAGDMRLDVGVVVTGRVIDGSSKAPVPAASVYLSSSNQAHQMLVTPGRERGIPGLTDAQGFFRFTNAPRTGAVSLVAEAPGYASSQLLNAALKAEGGNDFVLEIELGETIAGIVVDAAGKPIAGAQLRATGLSSKTPQQARIESGADGTFEFPALRRGPYELVATTSHHAELKVPLAVTGDHDVKIVMTTRGMVKLRVLAANQAAIKTYSISLKRFFPSAPTSIANVAEFNDRRITPGDYPSEFGGDWALVRGVPTGHYRFQVVDTQHAKTLSGDFKVEEGMAPVEVVVTMTLGGTISGTVINDRGEPVADAIVASDLNAGLAADSPIFEIFGNMVPEKHSKQTTRTDAQGRFWLRKLAFADYMVRVAHPQYCEGKAINLKVEAEGQTLDAGVIQLALGAIVEGVTSVGGVPTGQVKVTFSTPMPPELMQAAQAQGVAQQQQAAARALFNANVLSDGDGRFRLAKRVPPGTYKVTANRQSNDNPFNALIDIKETERQVTIAPGQDRVTIEFNLSPR